MRALSHHTDTDLLNAMNNGDENAFEMIYRKYVGELYRYARRNISSKEDCEELIQDVFESVWTRHKTLKPDTLRYYLLSMVKYKLIRYFQHSRVRKKYIDHYRAFEAVYDNVAEEAIDPAEMQARIEKSLQALPERCQVAFRLRLHENLSNGDIAQRMNITKKTVEVYMFQAFKHLRSSYHDLFKTG